MKSRTHPLSKEYVRDASCLSTLQQSSKEVSKDILQREVRSIDVLAGKLYGYYVYANAFTYRRLPVSSAGKHKGTLCELKIIERGMNEIIQSSQLLIAQSYRHQSSKTTLKALRTVTILASIT